ncbi:hypothetical protein HPO96_17140 [Kribbella sandramycini]|uniref:V8-like Glu-specific endopeptidase n=1 Tax=Kribbella sandramycini TaxID=60450 RepID=A0A7Y4P0K4_9ACTN|nr:hypothetical protein [Kribbella sandramycini]MBB6565711.1 V8-like Glu-specific endopeptidase [Kribbella sandramycini]NOL41973.1 hypothetical protein [Kribbella sandramycini]
MRNPMPRFARLLVAGVLISGGAVATAVAAPDAAPPAASTSAIQAPANPSKVPAGAIEATGYWTAEKMANAIPYDITVDKPGPAAKTTDTSSGVASHPVAPKLRGPDADPVPSTAGKLFFTKNGANYVCSASTINNNYKNLIVTAGHCVHSGAGGGWHANFVFAPAYYNGNSGYGAYNWSNARTFNSWINSSDFSHDQAFITLQKRNNVNVVDAVGGNGLVWGNGRSQANTRIWGWPAEPPYNGQVPYYCDGNTYAWGSTDAALTCGMNGGASGGPWLKDRINQNLGYVWAETSRRTTSGTPTLLATPNSADVKAMFDLMTT